ncbi:MAG: hypothetical protein JKX94_05995, partial [Sneathiella sp.]|nr:hypothetical protein [Sneathiella sp.]
MSDAKQTTGARIAGISVPNLLKDLAVTLFLGAAIFGTTIGFKTKTAVGGLTLELHLGMAAAIIGVIVVGRLILWLTLWRRPEGQSVSVVPESLKTAVKAKLS